MSRTSAEAQAAAIFAVVCAIPRGKVATYGQVAMLAGIAPADAQNYPSRPITMVVPLAPGGSTDVIARIMAEGMRPTLGQPIIVENTTGAGGTIGVGRVARAAPDGYTIGIGQWGTNVASGAIYPLQFDLIKDFEPVALIATQPFLIVAKKTMPANNLVELIAWLKANAGKASFRRKKTLEACREEAETQIAALKELEENSEELNRRRTKARERAAKERQARIDQAVGSRPVVGDPRDRCVSASAFFSSAMPRC